jgi:hypothetical protein
MGITVVIDGVVSTVVLGLLWFVVAVLTAWALVAPYHLEETMRLGYNVVTSLYEYLTTIGETTC